jgi:hypothetical protein
MIPSRTWGVLDYRERGQSATCRPDSLPYQGKSHIIYSGELAAFSPGGYGIVQLSLQSFDCTPPGESFMA